MMICECNLCLYIVDLSHICVYHRRPDALRYGPEPRKPAKALGDPPAQITSQSMATYAHDFSVTDLHTFMTLAKRYIFEGRDRTDICAHNSGVKPVYHRVMKVPLRYS